MPISGPVEVALIGALITLIGFFVTDRLERARALRLRNLEFRLDRYKEFWQAFSELSANRTYETQLRFVNGVNVVLLIGGLDLLRSVKDLVDNYNSDEKRSPDRYRQILNRIMLGMRRDLNARDSERLAQFEFPLIVPDIRPPAEAPRDDRSRQ
jgi:hypothetical protein